MRNRGLRVLLLCFALAGKLAYGQGGDALKSGFENPPEGAKPRVWWHWMNGNITKDGIKLDLEWMHRAGLGGFQNFDASMMTPQVVEKRLAYMTPDWKDAFKYAITVGDQLNLEMAIAGSPGWSETGGPWVPAKEAMKKYVWSETRVEGGKAFSGTLAHPPSNTGAFQNLRDLSPNPALIPYDLIVPFWSDGASKSRWISIPDSPIRFSSSAEWKFPPGTVFVKEFDLALDETNPSAKRRLETRFLVCDGEGGVYGVTYKWRPDGTDADLLTTSVTEPLTIRTASGTRSPSWYYPSREDCLTCHTANAGGVLGVKARQMNREFTYRAGVTANQLVAWNHAGLFGAGIADADLLRSPRLAALGDATRSLEDRARSYLDANCSQCHRPGGTIVPFDTRYETPLGAQGLIEAPPLLNEGIDHARLIAPHDVWRSILFMRVNTDDTFKMPPLARMTVDAASVELLRAWILSMPGPSVLDPPRILPPGGDFTAAVRVTLSSSEPGAVIHYTLDGSQPAASDPVYTAPFEIVESTVVRARAFKPGFLRSIPAQQIYEIAPAPGARP